MRWHRAGITVMLIAAALAWSSPASAATNVTINFALPAGGLYSIGVDHVRTDGTSPLPGYEDFYEAPYSQYGNNEVIQNLASAQVVVTSQPTLSQVRIEIYSRPTSPCTRLSPPCTNNPSNGDGAVAIRVPGTLSGTKSVGMVKIPKLGEASTGRFIGQVFSRDPIPDDRVRIEIFQTTGQPAGSAGAVFDAFSASKSVGTGYVTGPLWYGQYIAFITDDVTGRQAIGFLNLSSASSTFDLDLDIQCFGLDECQSTGSFPDMRGQFHALNPTRIVDTRPAPFGPLGMPGSLAPGDGRNSDPNSTNRLASRLGHEFRVTGVGGVPTTGVSAVLVNVTVTQGSASGGLRLIPKPPRTDVWQDQFSYPTGNYQARGIYWNAFDTRASMQLVKVGVGGRVRVESISSGHVHLIVDVVGWVDQGQPGQGGDRLVTVDPERLMDTRVEKGGIGPFGAAETRLLKVTEVAGIPANAKAVIGNLTATQSTARAFQTVWPSGTTLPNASVLNTAAQSTRPNMVLAGVGAGGQWSIYNSVPSTALIVDATGYFTAATGSTGKITAVPSAVVLAPTLQADRSNLSLRIVGTGGVPTSGVSAVFVLITAAGPDGGYITAYRSGVTTVPNVSNVNWFPGQTAVNLALVPVGADGNIKIFNKGYASITISVVGWVN